MRNSDRVMDKGCVAEEEKEEDERRKKCNKATMTRTATGVGARKIRRSLPALAVLLLSLGISVHGRGSDSPASHHHRTSNSAPQRPQDVRRSPRSTRRPATARSSPIRTTAPSSSSSSSSLEASLRPLGSGRRACGLYLWDFPSALLHGWCTRLVKDCVYEGRGGKKVRTYEG